LGAARRTKINSSNPPLTADGNASPTATVTVTATATATSNATNEPSPKSIKTTKPTRKKQEPTSEPAARVSKRQWAKIVEKPTSYKGDKYIIYGQVTQFDSATGDDNFLADTAQLPNAPKCSEIFALGVGQTPLPANGAAATRLHVGPWGVLGSELIRSSDTGSRRSALHGLRYGTPIQAPSGSDRILWLLELFR
jgi:hypothetical protein